MDYSIDYVRKHLPPEDPPLERVPRDVVNEIARWRDVIKDGDVELTARATRWTYAVFAELDLGRFLFERDFPLFWPSVALSSSPFEAVSFGLFDEKSEAAGLGIIIDVPGMRDRRFEIVDYLLFPRLNNQKFPLAIRYSELDLHVAHPQGATSACWAKCNRNSSVWGVLTAGHAVSTRTGGSVPMVTGGSASVARTYYQPVDAAFVKTAAPTGATYQLGVLSFPAMTMTVTVHCQGGSTTRTIVDVTTNCGVTHTRKIGIRFCIDRPASPGDSGALVTVANGDAVGIYTGDMKVPGPPPGVRGHAQNFEQAVYALDVTPYL
ncbi:MULTISPECIES: hypothetical protein [unclassified Novosphingobium]|uniref:hypothetical protein n=1 Tax=unclassified Novosphingobium TaxID=2644732 RepID=UPI00146BFA6D|nr:MULTISPECIES: hypothetical protein [unclassified Novosphingobium]NMN06601.1 hypothetical protein [Novosphingobium sp. SG919]NMN88949.1 hypothetical protein [Novosphingobium sp. SG916]